MMGNAVLLSIYDEPMIKEIYVRGVYVRDSMTQRKP